MIDPQSVQHLPGVPVLDVDGDIIGTVERVYVQEGTGTPLWVSIRTDLDGSTNAFAPLDEARFEDQPGSALHVGLDRVVVEGAPTITSMDTLTTDDVRALRSYYSGTAANRARNASSPDVTHSDEAVVVRSEEQLRVSTVSVPKERVRFQKVIVTEEKTITVTVRREELRIVREPILAPETSSPETSAAETRSMPVDSAVAAPLQIVLHEERVVVTTELVPVERVRIEVARVTEDVPVTDTVRKERVDLSSTAS